MSDPRNHHYVPQWQLREWRSTGDKKLQSYFRLPDGRLSSQRRSPKSVASEKDLYTWLAPDHPNPQQLEKEFFQQIDSRAATAAQVLRNPGTMPMSMNVRCDWARFLTASILRTPFGLNGWKAVFKDIAHDRLGPDMALVERLTLINYNDEALKKTIEHLRRDIALEPWMQMRWWVECVDNARYYLLTSDTPMVGRIIDGKNRMAFYPLSPNRLFCVTDDPLMAYLISSGSADFVVNWSNNLQVKEAKKFLFAKDDDLNWHIEKYFGEGFPDPPLPENRKDG